MSMTCIPDHRTLSNRAVSVSSESSLRHAFRTSDRSRALNLPTAPLGYRFGSNAMLKNGSQSGYHADATVAVTVGWWRASDFALRRASYFAKHSSHTQA